MTRPRFAAAGSRLAAESETWDTPKTAIAASSPVEAASRRPTAAGECAGARDLLDWAEMATKKPPPTGSVETAPARAPSKRKVARPRTKETTNHLGASPTADDQSSMSQAQRRSRKAAPHTAAVLELRAFGLSYPEAHTKSPWPDHLDLAVRGKTFAYLSLEDEPLRVSCKLPQSCQTALSLEFTEPTGYGLGKSGWVTATFGADDSPPVEFLKTWIDESYRAIAPKTLVKKLPSLA